MQRHEEEGGIVFYWLLFSKDHIKVQKSTKIARNLWYQTEERCRKEKKGWVSELFLVHTAYLQ